MYGMKKDQLRLVPHDPAWKNDFLGEKNRILGALESGSVRIEHVGSTAIPTVHAKPILDLAVLCGDEGVEPVARALSALGYHYRGQFDEKAGHFYAVLDQGGVRLCQAHIYPEAGPDWRLKLLFRDVLSRNSELAREYDDYKLRLAETAANKNEYAKIKTRWLDAFMIRVLTASEDS
jgi:GrpB-like predicted nucleotidyltransferase (UPF0157 family)